VIDRAMTWFEGGGPIMVMILAVGLVLYAVLTERIFALYFATPETADDRRKSLLIVRALVAAAPLLGLLGTVSGMIDSFDGLVGGGQINSIGRGIGYALRTTQYGLAIAAPGVILERIISRRSARLEVAAR
jgi:biopolymer transport protein ExbB/TolQ